jgi:hypothetical protein
MSDTPALDRLDQLHAEIEQLGLMSPLGRALAAHDLQAKARAVLGTVRDEAVHLALTEMVPDVHGRMRRRSYRSLAAALGLSVSTVNTIVTQYRTWLAHQRRQP